jgi:hypothetical protein
MEYRSSASFLGLPLVHIATGALTDGGCRRGVATAWFAVGDIAIGVFFACGGVALGGISLGGAALGLLPIGGFAFGLLAVGGALGGRLVVDRDRRSTARRCSVSPSATQGVTVPPNHALEPTAASVSLAVPSSLRSSAAAEGER